MTKLKIHPTAARFPAIPADEFEQLVEDVKAHGLRQPIVLTADSGTLVDGINRSRACEKAGVEPKYRMLPKSYTETDIINFIVGANLRRRDLNPGQRSSIIYDINGDLEAAAAKERQQQAGEHGKEGGRGKEKPSRPRGRKGKDRSGETREKLAKKANVGKTTMTKTKAVKEHSPALDAKVRSGEITINEAYKRVQKDRKSEPKETALSKTEVVLHTHLGEKVPYQLPKGKPHFTPTNDQVGWAGFTWNPVTGCLHNCPYCYAREMAYRPSYAPYYPVQFTPLFHHERLDAPKNTKVPEDVERNSRLGRVFVSSMGDLFGKWVPDEWIEKVFAAAHTSPEWEYLFLTKFPQRYVGLDLPSSAWIGTTVDDQYRVKIAEEAFRKISGVRVKWLSLEPLLAPLEFSDLSMFDWIVIGSQSATEQPNGPVPAFAPPFEWVARLTDQAHEAGCKVFQKDNLLGVTDPQHAGMKLIQEIPDLPPLPRSQMELFQSAAE
jgi:protein gp37/ParB-like chromosome segregation protein Spo0J